MTLTDKAWASVVIQEAPGEPLLSAHDPEIMEILRLMIRLHVYLAVAQVSYTRTSPPELLHIKFVAGQDWKIHFHNADPDPLVHYVLNASDHFRRSVVLEGISPLTSALFKFLQKHVIETITLIPR